MTRISTPGSRWPMSAHEMSEEDRATYRKWARFSYACYTLLIAGLLIVGLSTRQSNTRTATEDLTAGIGTPAKPAGQHHPGG
ncbi:MAG TPA: hypothetical protein VNY08_08560 [Bradyrhizobium sp.]|jgi:hypothetical protein|nr:hypothetical protein [Bradyrhizobium sp.]